MNNPEQMENILQTARSLDAQDPLRQFRSEFSFPKNQDGSDKLYFCGNSLGLQHESVPAVLEEVMATWRDLAVDGHFTGQRPWLKYHEKLNEQQAAMLGASSSEVMTMNTLSVNLHLAMVSFYRPRGKRTLIVIEKHAFPSDRYAVESQIRFHGLDPAECLLELGPREGERLIEEEQIEAYLEAHGERVALVLWPGVQYASGQVFDLQRIADAARKCGASMGFDLAHSAGNIPLQLSATACDFAVWCTYKYLNAGPGSVGGLFIHSRHHGRTDLPRFNGWFGNNLATRFEMAHDFDPAAGALAWQLSTPPTLAIAPLKASLDVFERAGFHRLREKSLAMTQWLAQQISSELSDLLEIITPMQAQRRGCQLSLRVRAGRQAGRALFCHLEEIGVMPDWREPDVVRASPVPLYNSYEDCARLVAHIRRWGDGL
jgi:kynureninase